ncbi:MAG: glutamate 5-kinase [Acidimicrobiia bacterium]
MRRAVGMGLPVVVKVGSSSLSNDGGGIKESAVETVVDQLCDLAESGYPPVLVSSGAIAAGLPILGMTEPPGKVADLQVAAAVGQSELMQQYASGFGQRGITIGQVLLTKDVLGNRTQYLNAKAALLRMLELGIVPIVNENDTVAVDEVRLGDNDQLAAIASHLIGADMLIILTDTEGLFTDDPRFASDAKLLTAVKHNDEVLDRVRMATGTGTLGRGGVATKITAARMAAFSGIPTVIASAGTRSIAEIVRGDDVGTWVDPRPKVLSARKLWIAFGLASTGTIVVDDGAVRAIRDGGRSLLGAGVIDATGDFERLDAVEVVTGSGELIAKGIVRISAEGLEQAAGRHSSEAGGEIIHRDDLVVLT